MWIDIDGAHFRSCEPNCRTMKELSVQPTRRRRLAMIDCCTSNPAAVACPDPFRASMSIDFSYPPLVVVLLFEMLDAYSAAQFAQTHRAVGHSYWLGRSPIHFMHPISWRIRGIPCNRPALTITIECGSIEWLTDTFFTRWICNTDAKGHPYAGKITANAKRPLRYLRLLLPDMRLPNLPLIWLKMVDAFPSLQQVDFIEAVDVNMEWTIAAIATGGMQRSTSSADICRLNGNWQRAATAWRIPTLNADAMLRWRTRQIRVNGYLMEQCPKCETVTYLHRCNDTYRAPLDGSTCPSGCRATICNECVVGESKEWKECPRHGIVHHCSVTKGIGICRYCLVRCSQCSKQCSMYTSVRTGGLRRSISISRGDDRSYQARRCRKCLKHWCKQCCDWDIDSFYCRPCRIVAIIATRIAYA